jgi:AAA15 family ATPase/GTPase
MFKSITIKNFRGIKELTIDDFKQVNLFVGANNSGKTSVLEALFIALNPNNPGLFNIANIQRGLLEVKPNQPKQTHINAYESSLKVLFHNLNFELPISIQSSFISLKEEREIYIKPIISTGSLSEIDGNISSAASTEIKERWAGLDFEFSCTGLDRKNKQEFFKFRSQALLTAFNSTVAANQMLEGIGVKSEQNNEYVNKLNENKIKQRTGRFISHNFGSTSLLDIESQFNKIKQKKKKNEFVKILQKIEPKIQDIDFTDSFIIDIGLTEMIRLETLGQGTVKLFALACMLIADEQNIVDGVLFIDELENGFHHSSQKTVWDFLFKLAEEKNIQIFATTHSEDCVKAFTGVAENMYKNASRNKAILYRLEKKQNDEFRVFKFDLETLETSLEKGREFR